MSCADGEWFLKGREYFSAAAGMGVMEMTHRYPVVHLATTQDGDLVIRVLTVVRSTSVVGIIIPIPTEGREASWAMYHHVP